MHKGYAHTTANRAAALLLHKIHIVKPFLYLYNVAPVVWLILSRVSHSISLFYSIKDTSCQSLKVMTFPKPGTKR